MKKQSHRKLSFRPHLIYPLTLLCALLLGALSCKKSNSGGGQPTSETTYLTSINNYLPGTQIADSISYDSSHRVVNLGYFGYDSTNGINPAIDSQLYAFTFNANEDIPNGYTFTYFQNGPNYDMHQLTFDGQNRISKDTSLSGTGYVAYYTYPTNEIAITVLYNGSFSNSQTDTLLIENGNITAQHIYAPNTAGNADSLFADLEFTYGTYANPAYDSLLSNTAGPLLFFLTLNAFGGYEDFISKNLATSVSGYGSILPPGGGLTLTPTSISNGKVTRVAETLGSQSGSVVFTYK